ncbi:hypothetical protein [Marinomonas fungiae]|uniref:hypothetical protein n=1 Tax=Marinomonas fungiae TaxID=1137284 RepID=UPI003A901E21
MNLPALGSLTGGGGLTSSSGVGGSDEINGGGNISFGVLPPLPQLPALPQMGASTLSVSGSASNNTVMILGVTVGAVVLGVLLMRGKR